MGRTVPSFRTVLVPWRRNLSENFKSAEELLRSDRGALVLEPRVGIYENTAEIDFASLFPSNRNNRVGAMNRYFGFMKDGTLKVRGIEMRRRDTPGFIKRLQHDMLDKFTKVHTVDELHDAVSCVLDVMRNYANEILSGSVDATELVFTTHTRHRLEEYKQKGSQAVQYVLTDHRSRYYHNRVKVAEMVDPDTVYDRMKYYDITLRAAESILRPFGYDADVLNDVVIGSKQMKVEWY